MKRGDVITSGTLIPAIGYIRVSAWFEEKISDELQKAAIAEASRRRNRRIVAWITDLDASGRNFKRKIMEAIEAVETGALEGAREIWVWKFSRFGRNRHGNALNIARVEAAGGQLISATEEVDTSTATGRLTRGMLLELAAFESDRIGEQWIETHDYRRLHGLPSNGCERFGYVWQRRVFSDGKLVTPEAYEPDPLTGKALADVYEAYAEGGAFLSLAKFLNANNLRNPHPLAKDAGWGVQTLAQYLDSGFGAGYLYAHASDVDCPTRAKCPRGRGHYVYLDGAQPSLITDEVWKAYQYRRAERKKLPPRARIPTYPFTSLIKCGLCQGSAAPYTGHGRKGYGWRCTRALTGSDACPGATVTTAAIQAEVDQVIAQWVESVDRRAAGQIVHPEAAPLIPAPRMDKRRVEGKILKVQEALDRASKQVARGIIPEDSYLRTRDELLEERRAWEAKLAEAAEHTVVAPANTAKQARIVRQLWQEWDVLPVLKLRDLLSAVIVDVEIWPKGYEPRVRVNKRDLVAV